MEETQNFRVQFLHTTSHNYLILLNCLSNPSSGRPKSGRFCGCYLAFLATSSAANGSTCRSHRRFRRIFLPIAVTQVISWDVKEMPAERVLIDLFPNWHGEFFLLFAFHPSRRCRQCILQHYLGSVKVSGPLVGTSIVSSSRTNAQSKGVPL